jgi:hypothetical protein
MRGCSVELCVDPSATGKNKQQQQKQKQKQKTKAKAIEQCVFALPK